MSASYLIQTESAYLVHVGGEGLLQNLTSWDKIILSSKVRTVVSLLMFFKSIKMVLFVQHSGYNTDGGCLMHGFYFGGITEIFLLCTLK